MSNEKMSDKEALEQQIALVEYMVKAGTCDGICCDGRSWSRFAGVECPFRHNGDEGLDLTGYATFSDYCMDWLHENKPSVKSEALIPDEVLEQQIALVEYIIEHGKCEDITCFGHFGKFKGTKCPLRDDRWQCIKMDSNRMINQCVEWIRRNKQSDQIISAHSEDASSNETSPCLDPRNNGGSTPSQYGLPEGAAELQDLIEHREMNFQVGNIFKACYRMGHCTHSDRARDLRKILYFAERELNRVTGESNKAYTE